MSALIESSREDRRLAVGAQAGIVHVCFGGLPAPPLIESRYRVMDDCGPSVHRIGTYRPSGALGMNGMVCHDQESPGIQKGLYNLTFPGRF